MKVSRKGEHKMNKSYSVRVTVNYYRNKEGKWCGHSSSVSDGNGRTAKWLTIEEAEEFAKTLMARENYNPNERGYINYCKIYQGNTFVKMIER